MTLFSFITSWFGYCPPSFKPRWAYLLVQSGVSAVWIGLGVEGVIFGEWIAGVIIIFLAIASLGIVLLRGEKETGVEQE
jgi:hypothetical protein